MRFKKIFVFGAVFLITVSSFAIFFGTGDGYGDKISKGQSDESSIYSSVNNMIKLTGSGTKADPYQITNVTELQQMNETPTAYYVLMNDIDASDTWSWNSGKGFMPVGDSSTPFTGSLDGQGYNITDLFINRSSKDYVGLFGFQDDFGNISNVSLINCDITGHIHVGGLVGNNNAFIENCSVSGEVRGSNLVGGLMGRCPRGTVWNSYSKGSVSTTINYAGGFVGWNGVDSNITNCYSTSNVTGSNVGGFVGYNNEGTIRRCYCTGTVTGSDRTGGFVGYNDIATIENCYSTGNSSGTDRIGGFVGYNYYSNILKSYSTGNANGDTNIGGFSGDNSYGTISDCFWDMNSSGNPTSDGGIGRSTTDLMMKSTFTDALWNFDTLWYIKPDISDYPELMWDVEVDYVINDLLELDMARCDLAGDYILANDIDASNTSKWDWNGTDYHGFDPIGNDSKSFTGSLDGKGYNVSNLFIKRPSSDNVGLFGVIGTNSDVTNISLKDCTINGNDRVGSLVGYMDDYADLDNCSVVSVPKNYVEFDSAEEDYVDFGIMSGFMNDTSWSIIERVKIPVGADDIGGWHMFRGEAWQDKQGDVAIKIQNVTSTSNVRVWLRKSGWNSLDMDNGDGGMYIDEGIWYDIGVVYNSTLNEYKLYVNGIEVDNDTGIGPMDDSENSNNLFFGGQKWGGALYSETDIAIRHQAWLQRCLNSAEISDYDGSIDPNTPELYFSTKITSSEVVDISGNGHNGTNGNSPYYGQEISSVSGNSEVGGLIGGTGGYNNISECNVDVDVQGTDFIGGLVGNAERNNIVSNCSVEGKVSGRDLTGGFIGRIYVNSTVSNCSSSSKVSGRYYVGGFMGLSRGNSQGYNIVHSYANGDVNGSKYVGGLVGLASDYSNITDAYASGNVFGVDEVGGLIGRLQDSFSNPPVLTHSYATGDVEASGNDIGGLVGKNLGIVTHSHATGDVSGDTRVGGLIGIGSASDSYTTGNVSGNESIGGLIGKSDGTVSNSYSYGSVNGSSRMIGGLIGFSTGKVIECYSTSDVFGNGSIMGGLIGECEASVSMCHNTGNVSGNNTVGGMIGYISGGLTVNRSYCTGDVSGGVRVGGFIGTLFGSTLENVYAKGDVHGNWGVSGLVGHYDVTLKTGIIDSFCVGRVSGSNQVGAMVGSDMGTLEVSGCFWDNETMEVVKDTGLIEDVTGITGKSTTEMQDKLTFLYASWEFGDIWAIKDGFTYPFFRWDYWNDAPLAFNDDYTTTEDDILEVVEPGPLANDDDPDLHACLPDLTDDSIDVMDYESTSIYGASVVMSNNGSFIYDPTSVAVLEGLGTGEEIVDYFNYTISDKNGRTDNATVFVTVKGENGIPVANDDYYGTAEDVLIETQAPGILSNDTDPDLSDELTVLADNFLTGNSAEVSVNNNGSFVYDPTYSDIIQELGRGEFLIDCFNYTIIDGNGGMDIGTVYINVSGMNDEPEIVTDDEKTATEDVLYRMDFDADDVELDTLTWNLYTNASWLSLDPNSGLLSGTPFNSDVGNYWVNVTVEDGNGGEDWSNFTLVVDNTNDAPVISTQDETTTVEDMPYTVNYQAFDDDMDSLTWSLNTDAGWLSMDTGGWLNGTPSNNDVGSYWINVSVSDRNGGSDHHNFMLNVVDSNDPPVIVTANNLTAIEGERYTVVYMAEDVDFTEDTLSWSIDTDADWLSMDPETGVLSGRPLAEDVGNYSIEISVEDGRGGTDSTTFILDVLADTDGDGIPDEQDDDNDNDGIPDSEDDFPMDPTEDTDTDGDGVGDNEDEDDDNDNWTDSIEEVAGTDPLVSSSSPKDTDSDGVADFMETTEDKEPDGETDKTPMWAYVSLLAAIILGLLALFLFMQSKKMGSHPKEEDYERETDELDNEESEMLED